VQCYAVLLLMSGVEPNPGPGSIALNLWAGPDLEKFLGKVLRLS